ncbi:MAG: uroporphyrinogen-III C-methyltransferase [Woeseiaceae bacterium]|nr:uroporphyrinogen-III C-methyltransferase [Woeseiaceae bacterium]
MSDTDKKAGDVEPDDAASTETTSSAEPDAGFGSLEEFETAGREDEAPATDAGQSRGNGGSIAWLSLLLAIIGVAGVGYLIVDGMRSAGSEGETRAAVEGVSGRLDAANSSVEDIRSEIARLDGELENARSGDARLSADIDRLQSDLERRGQLFDSLPPRMSSIERSVAALQGVSIDARNTYLVAEAEYYMQIANAQLQLAGNPYLASLALEQADDRLLQLADPALTDVRRALSDEMAALEVMEKPDVAGVTLTLASLARVVDSLPLKSATDGAEGESETQAEDAEQAGGVSRAWGSVKGAFSGLVKVTPPGDEQSPLLVPEAEPLIRSNLSLQLQAARLALLRGEQSIFEQSLEDADAWLVTYFDTTSEQVIGARTTIGEIRGDYSSVSAPDISGSLRLLRQFKTLSESTE